MYRVIAHSATITGLLILAAAVACAVKSASRQPRPRKSIRPITTACGPATATDGRIVVPTNQVLSPAGRQVAFSGRPTDVALSPGGRWLAVLDRGHVAIIDPRPAKSSPASRTPAAASRESFSRRMASDSWPRTFAAPSACSASATREAEGGQPISLPRSKGPAARTWPTVRPARSRRTGNARPAGRIEGCSPIGLALDPDGKTLWAVLNLRNSLAQIDLTDGKVVREIPSATRRTAWRSSEDKAYVSNWAGRHPEGQDARPAKSGTATPVRVDPRAAHRLRRLGLGRRSGRRPGS